MTSEISSNFYIAATEAFIVGTNGKGGISGGRINVDWALSDISYRFADPDFVQSARLEGDVSGTATLYTNDGSKNWLR